MGLSGKETLLAAVAQMDVALGDLSANLGRVERLIENAASEGAELVVLPECCLSGYCFESAEEARPHALPAESEELARLRGLCEHLRISAVLGFLEREGETLYNSAAVLLTIEGTTTLQVYRKTHLPVLGVDRYAMRGDVLRPFAAEGYGLGTLVCYDLRFPEAARLLMLQGVELLALPTNWPEGAETSPDFITRARAWENRIWLLAANRIGVERGNRFLGRSQIVSPAGRVVAEAGPEEEVLLLHNLDLREARGKRIVIRPGAWEMDPVGDRRPDLYSAMLAERLESHHAQ